MIPQWRKPLKVDVISSKRNGLRQTSLPILSGKDKQKKSFITHFPKN